MKIDDIIDELRKGILDLAKNTVEEFVQHAKDDFEDFISATRDDVERWTIALAEGKLTADEFRFLLKMRADLAEMHALTSVGIAATRLKRFRDGMISLIIKTIFAALG